MSEFTNKIYHLRSYLDLNEPEAHSISRNMLGLRWAIRERLSHQSFYYSSDLVSAAESIEKQMEIANANRLYRTLMKLMSDIWLRVQLKSIFQISAIQSKMHQLFHRRFLVARENMVPICHYRACHMILHTS